MVLATALQVFMIAMEHVPQNGGNLAMESVLRDMLSVVDIATVNLILIIICISVKALENASGIINNAMEPALMKQLSVVTTCASVVIMILPVIITAQTTKNATILATVLQVFMTAMGHALINRIYAMENVMRDTLSVVDIAAPNQIMTTIITLVKARENAKESINHAMEPVLMKEQSVEMTCASVVMTIPTAGLTV